ncbi:chaperone NapD [Flexibacterium corallicola]|uniref:chaperone NapD n=1 Tax=Flexibacterium corallicola TaxID=3037259 RepID=UPI00286F01A6|nr:chaperone NapD [Pseudovibrio sp. M1P-2-3]
MNICGILVTCLADRTEEVKAALTALDGVEVHLVHEKTNQLIVTAEDTEKTRADDQVIAIHRTPGVTSAALTYHQFEPELNTSVQAA